MNDKMTPTRVSLRTDAEEAFLHVLSVMLLKNTAKDAEVANAVTDYHRALVAWMEAAGQSCEDPNAAGPDVWVWDHNGGHHYSLADCVGGRHYVDARRLERLQEAFEEAERELEDQKELVAELEKPPSPVWAKLETLAHDLLDVQAKIERQKAPATECPRCGGAGWLCTAPRGYDPSPHAPTSICAPRDERSIACPACAPSVDACTRPPPGWVCTRGVHADGPCAAVPLCRGCGKLILPENLRIADGCPCNTRRGINHGLVPANTCTCVVCDPAQTGSTRYPPAAAVAFGETTQGKVSELVESARIMPDDAGLKGTRVEFGYEAVTDVVRKLVTERESLLSEVRDLRERHGRISATHFKLTTELADSRRMFEEQVKSIAAERDEKTRLAEGLDEELNRAMQELECLRETSWTESEHGPDIVVSFFRGPSPHVQPLGPLVKTPSYSERYVPAPRFAACEAQRAELEAKLADVQHTADCQTGTIASLRSYPNPIIGGKDLHTRLTHIVDALGPIPTAPIDELLTILEERVEEIWAARKREEALVEEAEAHLLALAVPLAIGALNKPEGWVPTAKDIEEGYDILMAPMRSAWERELRAKAEPYGIWCVNDRAWCKKGTHAAMTAELPWWQSGARADVDPTEFRYELRATTMTENTHYDCVTFVPNLSSDRSVLLKDGTYLKAASRADGDPYITQTHPADRRLAVPARLDEGRTAEPLTYLVAHVQVPVEDGITRTIVAGGGDTHVDRETGKRTSLASLASRSSLTLCADGAVTTNGCGKCYQCLDNPSKGFLNPVMTQMVLCPLCGTSGARTPPTTATRARGRTRKDSQGAGTSALPPLPTGARATRPPASTRSWRRSGRSTRRGLSAHRAPRSSRSAPATRFQLTSTTTSSAPRSPFSASGPSCGCSRAYRSTWPPRRTATSCAGTTRNAGASSPRSRS